jgi:tetratricopeptide (TPR) repeat protein
MDLIRTSKLLLIGGSLAAWAASSQAAPGGGGGGGSPSMPSSSAPQFDPAAEYRAGVEHLQANRFKEAKKAFDHVLEVAPRDANTNFLAGLAVNGLGDAKGARRYFERAVRADKKMVAAHRELGLVYAKLGDWEKARAQLDRLKALESECGAGCANATEIGGSIAALNSALAGAPTAALETRPGLIFTSTDAGDQSYLEAVSLINERRYEQALASLEAARKAFGPHPDILTYQGFANRKLGRFAAAETYYRAALAAAPEHRGAMEYYGELMLERGDRTGAHRMLASLDAVCSFGCAEADELRRWIEGKRIAAP